MADGDLELEVMKMNAIDPFFRDVTNVTNHRILLRLALALTEGSSHPVLAMGIDPETTRLLHDYCEERGRPLVSLEEDIFAVMRLRQMESRRHEVICAAWEVAPIEARGPWSVAVMNHAPGERRKDDAKRLLGRAEVVVLHDTEPNADMGYQFSTIWPRWRWKADVKTDGAWASAVSNDRDLSAWRGFRVGTYVVTMGDEETAADEVAATVSRMFEERCEDL